MVALTPFRVVFFLQVINLGSIDRAMLAPSFRLSERSRNVRKLLISLLVLGALGFSLQVFASEDSNKCPRGCGKPDTDDSGIYPGFPVLSDEFLKQFLAEGPRGNGGGGHGSGGPGGSHKHGLLADADKGGPRGGRRS